MKKLLSIYLFVFLLSIAFVSAQNTNSVNKDSLRRIFTSTVNDSVKLSIALQIMPDFMINDPDSAIALGLYASSLATSEKDTFNLAKVSQQLGVLYAYRGDNYNALQYELNALRYRKAIKDDPGIPGILNNIGESYYELDLYSEAYDYYNKSLNKSWSINDSLGATIATYNVGKVLKAMKQLKKAKKYIKEAKKLSEKINDEEGIAYALHDLGDIYLLEGNFDLALETLNEALKICKENKDQLGIYVLTPEILNKIAVILTQKGEYQLALSSYDSAVSYYSNHSNESGIAETDLGKGRTLIESGNLSAATKTLKLGLNRAKLSQNKGLESQIYFELSEIYEIEKDYERSLSFYKKHKSLGDSIYSEKKSEQFAQLQIKYETQQKDKDIALLEKREEQRKAKMKNDTFFRNVLVVILAFTALLLITLYRSGARRKKINELLMVHQKEIETQSTELERLLEMKDKFFSIVSHDLRSPINALVGILDMLNDGHLTQEELLNVTKSLRLRLDNTRSLLDNLLDWAMVQMNDIEIKEEKLHIKSIAEDNLAYFREVNDKNFNFFNKVKNQMALADNNMLNLVIRNLLSNSIKFTPENGAIEMYLEDDGDQYIICIGDNGVGMSKDQVGKIFDDTLIYTTPGTSNEKGTGLGLKLCKEFVNKMGGKIWVESEEGKGSVFKFTVKKA